MGVKITHRASVVAFLSIYGIYSCVQEEEFLREREGRALEVVGG
jgi:hypothetical protein